MGLPTASCRNRKRRVSTRRYSANAAQSGHGHKLALAAERASAASGSKRRRQAPRRSQADLDLGRRMLAALRRGSDVRLRKVRRLKAAIKVRAYENNLKFQVAVERLGEMVEVG